MIRPLVCLAIASIAFAQSIPVGQQPMAIAVNEVTNKAYVINHGGSSVSVIDGKTRTVVATVNTGGGPEGLAVNPVTNRIYVASPGGSSVTVIDGATDTVAATVKTGSYPQAVAVNTATNKIYVVNNYAHSITVIDGATNEAAIVRVGQGPRGIVANPATNKIYTANYGSRDASEIDGATNAVTAIPTGKHPWTIAADTRANRIFVVNEDSAAISIIDGRTRTVRQVAVGETPFAIAVNSATDKAYVLSYLASSLAVIDGLTAAVVKTVPLAAVPSAVAVNPKTNQIYIASQKAGTVQILDAKTYVVLATLKAGALPYAVAVDSALNQAYVANYMSADATIIPASATASPAAWPRPPKFRVVALAERGSGDHQSFVDAARVELDKLALANDFTVDYINGTERINDKFLEQYQLLIQLNYPPYRWAPVAKDAFVKYVSEGKGGWIGFHHASLLGEFDGYPMDPWFSQFLGGIRFTHYIADFAKATVHIEDPTSPLAKGLPSSFVIEKEEWYTWSKSPRPNVKVFATVDEASYVPNSMIKMGGDHPVVWSNPHFKARNLYIFMGHHAGLFDSAEFLQLFRNAVFWGAGQ